MKLPSAQTCLQRFQEKYPFRSFESCEMSKDDPEVYLLKTDSTEYQIRYDAEKDIFSIINEQNTSYSKETSPDDWDNLPKPKTGALPKFISFFAVLCLIGSIIAGVLIMFVSLSASLTYLLVGILASLLLFAVSAIVKSVRAIEMHVAACRKMMKQNQES